MEDGCLDPDTLAAYVDARLAADLRARADRHIDVCATCRREVSALVAVETRTVQLGPRRPPIREIPATLGRYRIIRELGRGAMGVVLHAYDPELARPVAIKLLHHAGPDTRRRLRGEAQAMARLRHPNIVAIYDVAVDGETMFVAMELVAGDTLATLAAPWPARLAAGLAAGRGLAAAHAAHLVHRDVKPANVLCGASGDVRITDFGLACPDDASDGGFAGTPAYMAPEVLAGGPATPRSDQFSYCVMLYELLYGRRPFPAAHVDELRAKIALGPRLPACAIPGWLGAAIARGLAVDPAARHPSIDALLASLERAPSGWRRLASMLFRAA